MTIIITSLMIISLYFYNSNNETELNNCYLVIHNFFSIRYNKSNMEAHLNKSFDLKTYVSSYTKPYLIEMISNLNKTCVCCE